MIRCLSVACLLAFLVPLAGPGPAIGAERGGLAIIIDSSKPMGQKAGAGSKARAVGNALSTNFVKYDNQLDMALIVMGGAARNTCEAVSVVQDFSPLRAPSFAKELTGLKPRGKAPVTGALRATADALAAEEGLAYPRIILIAGSGDSCNADPCADVAAIMKRLPGLRIDVVAVGAEPSKGLQRLQCLAKASAGEFILATDERATTRVIDRLLESVVTIAETRPSGTIQIPPAGATGDLTSQTGNWETSATVQNAPLQPETVVATPRAGEGAIRVVAALTTNDKPIPDGLVWRIYSALPNARGRHKLIKTDRAWSPVVQLPAGEYLINVAYGRAHLTRKVAVNAGEVKLEPFILHAGGLRLTAVDAKGNPVSATHVNYDVLSGEQDQFGNRKPVITRVKPGLIVRLNAGIYHIVSRYGDANAVRYGDVTVEAGKLTQIVMTHDGSKITLKLVARPGGEAIAGTRWRLQRPDGTLVKQTVGALPSHVLAPGDYEVIATHSGRAFSGTFNVAAGVNQQIELVAQ